MPYKYKKVGDKYVVYKKDTGKRVGATAGNKQALHKYLSALHINAKEETMKTTKGSLLRELIRNEIRRVMQQEKATFTDKHDDHPSLKGGQDELPDELQKAIISKGKK